MLLLSPVRRRVRGAPELLDDAKASKQHFAVQLQDLECFRVVVLANDMLDLADACTKRGRGGGAGRGGAARISASVVAAARKDSECGTRRTRMRALSSLCFSSSCAISRRKTAFCAAFFCCSMRSRVLLSLSCTLSLLALNEGAMAPPKRRPSRSATSVMARGQMRAGPRDADCKHSLQCSVQLAVQRAVQPCSVTT